MTAAFAVMNSGPPGAGDDKAFKRVEDIFAKYPICRS